MTIFSAEEVYGRHAIRDDIFHGFAVYDLVIDEDVQVGDIVVSAQLDIYFPEGLSHIRGQIAAVPARRPDLSGTKNMLAGFVPYAI